MFAASKSIEAVSYGILTPLSESAFDMRMRIRIQRGKNKAFYMKTDNSMSPINFREKNIWSPLEKCHFLT